MGGLNLLDLVGRMGGVAIGVGLVLVIMSMWSFGVAIERYYTFAQARKQSKLYAPQVGRIQIHLHFDVARRAELI